jgi:two-component system, cell cycle sensor histidine kinase and response regulator CckA
MQVQREKTLGEARFGETTTRKETVKITSGEVIGWHPEVCPECSRVTETILFVEDEAFVREVTSEVLRDAGYEVLTAENAREAMRLFEQRSHAIDFLLADLVLPGESGRQLAARLSNEDPGLKVLFVTGYAEHMKMEDGQECLPKPFTTSALLERVRRILDRPALAAAV